MREASAGGVLPVLCLLWLGGVGAQSSGPGPVNIAREHPSSAYTQSSPSRPPSNGANGNTSGTYSAHNCIRTSPKYYYANDNPWWQVDLGQPYYLYNFKIWAQSNKIYRMYPFTITVDNTTCVKNVRNPYSREITVNCTKPVYGQRVRITRGPDEYFLNMCEFQIYVCNPGYHGMDCNQRCSQDCTSEGCYMNDGKCINCQNGFWGDQCQHSCGNCTNDTCDIGTGTCSECQIGMYGNDCQFSCSDKTPDCDLCDRSGQCTACSDNLAPPNCTECQIGMYGNDCQFSCSDKTPDCDLCDRSGQCTACSDNLAPPNCTACKDGYYKSNNDICKTCSASCPSRNCHPETGKCNGCYDGRYGDQCERDCPARRCLRCDQDSGQCTACKYNRKAPKCTECQIGMYGNDCQFSCSDKTPDCDLCDRSGQCTACSDNLEPPNCTACKDGYYKSNNDICKTCSTRCPSRSCHPETGKCNGCYDGRYGDQCEKDCPGRGCVRCDQDSGQCTACKYNQKAPNCTDCLDGYYSMWGWWCSECTWTCLNGTTCDKATGDCPVCPPGKKGPRCYSNCDRRTYGQNCSQQCGRCDSNARCDVVDGSCISCRRGFQLPLCKEECENGTYGVNCKQQCGQCLDGAACDKASGNCQQCEPGWYSPDCKTPCNDGWYGMNCKQMCGECLNGAICNKTNGHCPCPVGKKPPLCDRDCPAGLYGEQCNQTCGHCQSNSTCQHVTGECLQGCAEGFNGMHCMEECENGTYGVNCKQQCGQCLDGAACDKASGNCQQCEPGWYSPDCKTLKQEDGLQPLAIVGGILVVIIIIIIIVDVVGIVVLKKKGGKKAKRYRDVCEELSHSRQGLTDPPDPSIITTSLSFAPPPSGSEKQTSKRHAQVKPKPAHSEKNYGEVYENMSLMENHGEVYENMSLMENHGEVYENMTLLKNYGEVYENMTLLKFNTEATPTSAAGATGQRPGEEETPPEAITDDEVDFEFDEEVYANEQTMGNVRPTSIRLDMLQETVLDKLRHGQLDEEFLRMPLKKDYTVTNGRRKENYCKNRFNNILPYDKSRVELKQVDGDEASDYINASFIKGHKSDKDYIAAQGPKVNTQDDWWRMVWQEGVTDIVMLTNLMEGIKHKCYQYWPAVAATLNTGHMVVIGVDERHRAHFVIRDFDIKLVEGTEKRRVKQYHYLSWMDREVPATTPLVNFWRYVTARAPRSASTSPLLVHCSPGIGRTGIYIALDVVLAHAREEAEVDVYSVVDNLGNDRCHMVQNKDQYAFLHKAVLEAYLSENTRMQTDDFDRAFPHTIRHNVSNQRIDAEFQKLCKMRNYLTTATYNNATQEENQAKNHNPNALPDDKYLVLLTQHAKGRNRYINAVYMPTFLHARGSITTQLPLPDTVIDMWRLIDGCDVTTVVSLGDMKGQNMCRYWPRPRESLETGPYTISVQSMAHIGDGLDSYILTMHKEKQTGKSREVRVLHFKGWRAEGEESMGDLTHILDILHSSQTPQPVIVQCIDGAAQSGVFCALWDVMSRLKSDGEVDVYLTARQVTTVTPQAFTAVQEYRYCYEVLQNFKNSHDYYANT